MVGMEGVEECRCGGDGGGGGGGEGRMWGEVQPTQWVCNRFLSIDPGFMGDWLSKKVREIYKYIYIQLCTNMNKGTNIIMDGIKGMCVDTLYGAFYYTVSLTCSKST